MPSDVSGVVNTETQQGVPLEVFSRYVKCAVSAQGLIPAKSRLSLYCLGIGKPVSIYFVSSLEHVHEHDSLTKAAMLASSPAMNPYDMFLPDNELTSYNRRGW